MIRFDVTKLRVEHMRMKSCTTTLGGSISVVDPVKSTDSREVYKSYPAPFAVVRAFQLANTSKFIRPILVAVTFYENMIVALEKHTLGAAAEEEYEGLFGTTKWKSNSEISIERDLTPRIQDERQWFIDGSFVYAFTGENAIALSSDHKFVSLPVDAFKLADVGNASVFGVQSRACVKFTTSCGQSFVTGPIWKTFTGITRRNEEEGGVEENSKFSFDHVDERMAVNLAFILKAAGDLSKVFGYEAIEPLGLDELMVEHKTVNLPTLPKAIKSTYMSGTPVTHMFAWLMGLQEKTTNLGDYATIRALIKMLTTKGVTSRSATTREGIFRDGKSVNDIQAKTMDQARTDTDYSNVSWEVFAAMSKRRDVDTISALGDLLND